MALVQIKVHAPHYGVTRHQIGTVTPQRWLMESSHPQTNAFAAIYDA